MDDSPKISKSNSRLDEVFKAARDSIGKKILDDVFNGRSARYGQQRPVPTPTPTAYPTMPMTPSRPPLPRHAFAPTPTPTPLPPSMPNIYEAANGDAPNFFKMRENPVAALEIDLESEKPLESNVLIYVMKELYENDSEQYDKIMASPNIKEQFDKNPSLKDELDERIENLEYFKTPDYIFLFPMDQWEKNRLPSDGPDLCFTPNLTAIVRRPVIIDTSKDLKFFPAADTRYDHEQDRLYTIYDESWVGKEVQHFPWCEQLFMAEKAANSAFGKQLRIPDAADFYRAAFPDDKQKNGLGYLVPRTGVGKATAFDGVDVCTGYWGEGYWRDCQAWMYRIYRTYSGEVDTTRISEGLCVRFAFNPGAEKISS